MQTIDEVIDRSISLRSDSAALASKKGGTWVKISYRELGDAIERIAGGLIESGLKPGGHAAIYASSSPRWVMTYLGILKARGVVVPVDKELKSFELLHILSDSDAKFVFCDDKTVETLLPIASKISTLEKIVLINDGATTTPPLPYLTGRLAELWSDFKNRHPGAATDAAPIEKLTLEIFNLLEKSEDTPSGQIEKTSRHLPAGCFENSSFPQSAIVSFETFLRPPPDRLPPRDPEKTAVILYTSGTTGKTKGAMLSHRNIVSNITAAARHFNLKGPISTLSFLPINHVFEQVCGILLPLSLGGNVTFVESVKKIGENLLEIRPTFFLGVPALYTLLSDRFHKKIRSKPFTNALYSFPLTRQLVSRNVRALFGKDTIFVSGGAPLDPAVAESFRSLGLRLYQGYGITETSPVISAESEGQTAPGSVGRPIEEVEVRIEDPNAEGIGEIVVKGPNVMQGYYKNSKATREVIRNGWYHTGDLGRFDEKGFLHICGRVKNLIVTPNGKNVYPEEVESILVKSPFIAEAMVYGHKVEQSAEEVCAVIYPNPEALANYRVKGKESLDQKDVEELIRREILRVGRDLADYKRIRKFTLREDEFPKTSTRKIKRYAVDADLSVS